MDSSAPPSPWLSLDDRERPLAIAPQGSQRLTLFDNTRITSAKKCLRDFYFRHHRHWAVEGDEARALVFGSAWHEAMNALWPRLAADPGIDHATVEREAWDAFCGYWEGKGFPIDMSIEQLDEWAPRTPMVAKEMISNYIDRRRSLFAEPTFELIAVERPFAVPLDPNDPTLWYVGRLDKVFKLGNRIICGEHKTTTSYQGRDPNHTFKSSWLESFSPNSQIDGYLYALRYLYGDTATSLHVDGALVHKKTHNQFIIIPVERQFAQLDAWLWTTHYWIDQIRLNTAALESTDMAVQPYMTAFPQNTNSCGGFSGCAYIGLCKGTANPTQTKSAPYGFISRKWEPFDEIRLESLGPQFEAYILEEREKRNTQKDNDDANRDHRILTRPD